MLVMVPVLLAVGARGQVEGSFFLVVMVVLYAGWQVGSTVRLLAVVGTAVAAPWVVAHWLAPGADIGWTAWSCASGFTLFLGRGLRRQQQLIDQLQAAQQALAEQAVAEERRRLARELHDLAGHTLAAVLLHVTGARHVLRRDVDEAERALRDAETVGRASLDQIRATVAALRTDERGTDPPLAGAADLARPGGRVPAGRVAGRRGTRPGGPASWTGGHRAAPDRSRSPRQRGPARPHQPGGRDGRRAATARCAWWWPTTAPPPAARAAERGHFGLVGMAGAGPGPGRRSARRADRRRLVGGGDSSPSACPRRTGSPRDPGPDRRRPAHVRAGVARILAVRGRLRGGGRVRRRRRGAPRRSPHTGPTWC